MLIRWRCDRSGHEFEVMVAESEPEMVICGRCGHQWSVVSWKNPWPAWLALLMTGIATAVYLILRAFGR